MGYQLLFFLIAMLHRLNLIQGYQLQPQQIQRRSSNPFASFHHHQHNHRQVLPPQLRRANKMINLHAVTKHQVIIEHDGQETILQVPTNCNILDAALDKGLELSYDCKLGVCLTCPAKILSGKVDQSEGTLDESVMQQGYALMCIAKPQSDVRIRVIEEDELISAQFKRDS